VHAIWRDVQARQQQKQQLAEQTIVCNCEHVCLQEQQLQQQQHVNWCSSGMGC
jgi:hypothetical protein